jgi:hypothetical protein
MREVCVNVSVKPGTLAQQVAWTKLWQLLLAPEAKESSTSVEKAEMEMKSERGDALK